MKKVLKNLGKINLNEYAPVPFWSWNNDLESDELIEQIHQMKESGCGGFIIHARTGLINEYLSEDWFSLVDDCLKEARKLNLNVWLYDENGWPSGFVGGKLLETEEFRAPFLEKQEKDVFDYTANCVFALVNGEMKRVSKGELADDGKYICIYVKRSPANTDILNPDTVKAFISTTHEEYFKRFSDYFGKEVKGFFTDEPQYYRWGTPFTYSLVEYFSKTYGEDVFDGLYHLFTQNEEGYSFRVKYYKALNHLYVNNYYKALYDWCDNHNCMLTGHSVEETKLFSQMWGGAGCSTSYEFEHIPGIDNLGKTNPASLSARQVGSVAGQLGKKQILTETFGCAGYDCSPRELKAIAEKQYVHGVNLMCQHLYSYSLKGQGKTDHPPCFSPHITWGEEFKEFNTYFTRLGYLLGSSSALVNCAVISPMSSIHLNYLRHDETKAQEIDIAFDKFIDSLNSYGILFDIVDETILSRHGSVVGDKLKVGEKQYQFVIVPEALSFYSSTKEILEKYVEANGNIYLNKKPIYTDGIKDDWSNLKANCDLIDVKKGGIVNVESKGKCEYTYRKGDGFEFLYIVNVSKDDATVTLDKDYNKVDLFALKTEKHPKEFTLSKGESVILSPKGKAKRPLEIKSTISLTDFEFVKADLNNLTIDKISYSTDGQTFSKEYPIVAVFDKLLKDKYKGKLFIKYTFNVADGYAGNTILRRESGKYLSSTVNGIKVDFKKSKFDFKFEEAEIGSLIKDGVNEYVAEIEFFERDHVHWALFDPLATESVRNCLWYDTEIENVYILGDFSVGLDRVIRPFKAVGIKENFTDNGFMHFAGSITYKTKVNINSKKAILSFEGKFMSVRVKVNGKEVGNVWSKDDIIIPLNKGKDNLIEITVISSLVNMFGPFHFNAIENLCDIAPFHFTLRGLWNNFTCPHYKDDYYVRPFGIESITLSEVK